MHEAKHVLGFLFAEPLMLAILQPEFVEERMRALDELGGGMRLRLKYKPTLGNTLLVNHLAHWVSSCSSA